MRNLRRVQCCPQGRLLCCVCSSPGASVAFLQAHLEGRLYEQTGPLHPEALGSFRVQILHLVVRTEMLCVPHGLFSASSWLHYYLCQFIPQHYNYKESLGTIRILHWWFGMVFLHASLLNCCQQCGIRQHSAIWSIKLDVTFSYYWRCSSTFKPEHLWLSLPVREKLTWAVLAKHISEILRWL